MTHVLARTDAWLARAPIRRIARALAIVQALLLALAIAGTHGWLVPGVGANTTDYASFYAAGALADAGTPALAYDEPAHRAAEEAATRKGIEYEYFFYPPTFLLLCAPLAKLPYLASFLLFALATFAAWLTLATRIAGPGSAAPLLAIGPVWWTLGLGQNAFLTAALAAGATLAIGRRPLAAGALLGLLCIKPHFGLVIPLALIAGRAWRAFAGAALTLAAAIALTFALFGVETWRRFLAHERAATATLYSAAVKLAGHVEPRGAALLLGFPAGFATLLGAAGILAAALAVILVWRRPRPEPRAAALASAMLAAAPFALFYDLMLASVAGAWLARAGRTQGWRLGEPTALAAAVVASILAYPLAALTHVQIGTVIAPGLLALAYRRSLDS